MLSTSRPGTVRPLDPSTKNTGSRSQADLGNPDGCRVVALGAPAAHGVTGVRKSEFPSAHVVCDFVPRMFQSLPELKRVVVCDALFGLADHGVQPLG